jgi:hypothetical protein
MTARGEGGFVVDGNERHDRQFEIKTVGDPSWVDLPRFESASWRAGDEQTR